MFVEDEKAAAEREELAAETAERALRTVRDDHGRAEDAGSLLKRGERGRGFVLVHVDARRQERLLDQQPQILRPARRLVLGDPDRLLCCGGRGRGSVPPAWTA